MSSELEHQEAATLLFVDDESNILSALRRLFRSEGYEIITANSAADALEILELTHVDLIVSDMRMPEMDGARFLEIAAQKWPDTVRILLTGYADLSSAVHAINQGDIYKYLSKPWEDNDIKTTVRNGLERHFLLQERNRLQALTNEQNQELKMLNLSLEDKVKARTEELHKAHAKLESAFLELKQGYGATVKSFSSLIELRGGMMSGHSRQVADQARNLAIKLGIDKAGQQDVLFAGLLHDVGYLALSDQLANTPFNELSKEERSEVAKHVMIGEAALMALGPLQGAARIIRHHHELFDGSGYPDGLSGNKIPLGARILMVVDEYDALQRGLLFNEKMSDSEAQEYIKNHAQTRYDPKVVDVFLAEFAEGSQDVEYLPEQKDIMLRSGQLHEGMVIARDLIVRNGVMLLSRDHVLDLDMIEKIRRFEHSFNEVFEIYVLEDGLQGSLLSAVK